jgi:hypothetical protein
LLREADARKDEIADRKEKIMLWKEAQKKIKKLEHTLDLIAHGEKV